MLSVRHAFARQETGFVDLRQGLDDPGLQRLKTNGLKLFACAYGAQRRSIPQGEQATFGGLTIVSDLIAATDRFVSLN